MGVLFLFRVDVVTEIFFCSWSRWTFTVKGYWGICLDTRLADRPGHDVKWKFLMATMKVDLTGLKAAA